MIAFDLKRCPFIYIGLDLKLPKKVIRNSLKVVATNRVGPLKLEIWGVFPWLSQRL